jgi:hypothetical protein
MLVKQPTMPRKPKRNDVAVKVDAEVVRKARVVATYREVPLAELLSELLAPVVEKEYRKFKTELIQEEREKS